MRLACNIDRRGRLARLVPGLGLLLGALLVWTVIPSHPIGFAVVLAILGLVGAIMVFEGASGFCILRGIGVQTRL